MSCSEVFKMQRSVSLWKSTKKTNLKHNNREQSEYENEFIDQSREQENKYLIQDDIRELYEREFGESLKEYNAKQKRNDRKIKSYYNHLLKGKKTSPQQEMILQIGEGKDYEFGDTGWQIANEILERYVVEFEERNPNLKVYNAVIHNDETTPHLHLNFVPVAEGYVRGLKKQVAFDRAIKQQDKQFDVARPFDLWREQEVNVITEMMREYGIERKLVGTNEYEDTNELKEVTKKLRKLEVQVESELEKLDVLAEETKSEEDEIKPIIVPKDYEPMPEIEVKRVFGKNIVDPGEVESLRGYALRQKQKNKELQDEIDKRDENYRKLRKSYLNDRRMIDRLVENEVAVKRDNWSRERLNYDRKVDRLLENVNTLENENKALRSEIGVLRDWKDRAIQFMQNTKVFERFETWLKKLNKKRNQDFER